MFYHIILTEKCNSRCTYCYEKSLKEFENGLEKKWDFEETPIDSNVDINKLKEFIDKDNDSKIIFYGGEPLLELEKIKNIMDNIQSKFYLQTNGKLLPTIPEKYLKRISKILISIDGTKERTDKNREKGNYDLVLKNIKKIRKKDFLGEIVARMTIISPDINEQIKHLINLNIFDSFHWQLDAGFFKNDFNESFEKFAKEYNKSVSKLIDYWIDKISSGKVLKIYPFLGIFESLYYGTKTKLRCGSGYSNYTITTHGKISACPIMNSIKDFYCGDLNSNPKELKQIHCGEPCLSCEHYDLCGGRCLYSNYTKLWPKEGEKLICSTIIHLIEEIRKKIPEIKELIEKEIINEEDFGYEKYFGPEIIP